MPGLEDLLPDPLKAMLGIEQPIAQTRITRTPIYEKADLGGPKIYGEFRIQDPSQKQGRITIKKGTPLEEKQKTIRHEAVHAAVQRDWPGGMNGFEGADNRPPTEWFSKALPQYNSGFQNEALAFMLADQKTRGGLSDPTASSLIYALQTDPKNAAALLQTLSRIAPDRLGNLMKTGQSVWGPVFGK